jgi:hypothetical protein
MCNLAGYSGSRKANIGIIKLLAIYGRDRGKDGFGIYISGKLYKAGGWQNEGDSFNVLKGVVINKGLRGNNTIIMHNRAKSVGTVNRDNAHPFRYNYIKDKNFIIAHNGTIKNIDALCIKYNIEQEAGVTDSYYLGKIIYENGFKVLTEYEGFAALSIFDVNTDTLYLWKGHSQCESGKATEERPLHIYTKKGILYYASEEVSLKTALNTENGIYPLAENTLTVIKDGVIVDEIVYDRSHIVYKYNTTYYQQDDYFPAVTKASSKSNAYVKPESMYIIEPSPQNEANGKIFCWQTKYWKQGHVLNGAWSVSEDGTAYMATKSDLEKWTAENDVLKLESLKFFYRGYMIKNKELYDDLFNNKKDPETFSMYDFAQKLHTGTIYIRLMYGKYTMYHNGMNKGNVGIIPLFSHYSYKNEFGKIVATKVRNEDEIADEAEYYANKAF